MNMEDYEFTRETASQIIAELKAIKEAVKISYICETHNISHENIQEKICIYCLVTENEYLKRSLFRIERAIKDAKGEA